MDKSPCNCSPLLLSFQVSKSWPCGQMAKPTWGNSPGVFDSSYNTQLRPIPLVRLLCISKEGTDKQHKNDVFAHFLTWLCEWKTLSTFSCDLKCSSSWNDQSTKQKIPVQTCVVNKQMWGGGLVTLETFPSWQNSFPVLGGSGVLFFETSTFWRSDTRRSETPHPQSQAHPVHCWERCLFPSGLFHDSNSILAVSFRILGSQGQAWEVWIESLFRT